MQGTKHITIISSRKKIVLGVSSILYVFVVGKNTQIHILGEKVYETKMSLNCLEKELGDGFIRVHRGCLVSAMRYIILRTKLTSLTEKLLNTRNERKNKLLNSLV